MFMSPDPYFAKRYEFLKKDKKLPVEAIWCTFPLWCQMVGDPYNHKYL